MKKLFKNKSFDSLIGKDASLSNLDELKINGDGHRLIVDGIITSVKEITASDQEANKKPATLVINGLVTAKNVTVPNVVVTGNLFTDKLWVEDVLAIQNGAIVKAGIIYYRNLVIEEGAIIMAQLKHLDHVSEGEQT